MHALVIRALIVALAATPLLVVPASAQARDFDCADFNSQADAQSLLEADPSDPYRLDPDGDGVACEVPLPSGHQIVAYLILAIGIAIVAGYVISIWYRRRRARSAERQHLEERFASLQENLRLARNAIAGIDEEISERRRNVEQLQGEAQRAEELSRLGAEEVEAVQHALREVVSSFDRRSMKVQIIVAAVTSVLSIIGSVLVNIFVP